MKIIVCLSRIPYPLNKGDKLRAFYQIKELSKNNDIYLFCLNNKKANKQGLNILKNYCKEIKVEDISLFSSIFSVFKAIFSSLPLQVAFYTKKRIIKSFDDFYNNINPKISYFQFVRTAEYAKSIQGIKVLDFQDCLSLNMKRRSKVSKGLFKYIFHLEAKRLTKYENLMFDIFSKCTIITSNDRDGIQSERKNEIEIITNGVDNSFLYYNSEQEKEYDIIFSGNMSYAPNVLAANFLIKDIMPIVWKEKPNIKVVICGSNPKKEVINLGNKNVIVTGWVNDMKDYYAKSKIFIAPMQIGTGLQNKLLEAMAMNLPSITTYLANKSLMAQNNKDILIGNNKEELASCILSLLDDSHLYSTLSKNGKEYVRNNFSWINSTEKLYLIFQQLTKS